jgi:hypothetical protein
MRGQACKTFSTTHPTRIDQLLMLLDVAIGFNVCGGNGRFDWQK